MPPKTQKFKLPPPSESLIQTRIIQRLRVEGWLVVRINGGGFKDERGQFVKTYIIQGLNAYSGFPDLMAFKGNRFVLIEVKDHKGKLTDSQRRFHDYAADHKVEVWTLRHWDELDEVIEA